MENKTQDRRANNAFTIIPDVWGWVTDKLKENWSPQQIAGYHRGISYMNIYRYME